MADSYGLGAQHPTPAEVGADAEPRIYDPVAEHTDAERDAAPREIERAAAEHAAARRKKRETEAPWKRTAPGQITFRDTYWHQNPVFLGPFGPGDKVQVNGEISGVIEYVTNRGFLVMPEMGPGKRHIGQWVVGANVRSIRPLNWFEEADTPAADDRVVTNDREGDESLPMRPPPMQPGGEATFR